MKVDQSFEKILTSINDLENKAMRIKNKGELSTIELDLIKQRVRELYDQLLSIDIQEKPGASSPPSEAKGPIHSEPIQETLQKKPTEDTTTEDIISQSSASEIEETESEPKNEPSPEKIPHKTEEVKETKASKNNQEIVADKYQNTKTFRHDNLAKQQPKNDLSSKIQSKPITDLSKASGVNDKFLFIRELFDGNRDRYHEAIQLLNEIPTFEEAETYLKETFDWDWEDPVTGKFIELIKRKFIANQE